MLWYLTSWGFLATFKICFFSSLCYTLNGFFSGNSRSKLCFLGFQEKQKGKKNNIPLVVSSYRLFILTQKLWTPYTLRCWCLKPVTVQVVFSSSVSVWRDRLWPVRGVRGQIRSQDALWHIATAKCCPVFSSLSASLWLQSHLTSWPLSQHGEDTQTHTHTVNIY